MQLYVALQYAKQVMSYNISSFSASCFGESNAQLDFWVGRK